MKVFFCVGEPSGDQHAAHVIEHLKQKNANLEFVGYGGPEMRKAGCEILFPLTKYAVMGLFRVLPLLWTFIKAGFAAKRYFRESKPDLVVLVDFPGFNAWIAYFARKAGIRVVYFLPPQLWAWGPWRVKRIQRNVDLVLSGLSFETEWYRQHGVDAQFVGHPIFDELSAKDLDVDFIQEFQDKSLRRVAVLPGSRNMEISLNWPVMLRAMDDLYFKLPDCRFIVANYKPHHVEYCLNHIGDEFRHLPIEFHTGKTSEIIAGTDCCFMVSGSVSLEVLARAKPAVVLYRGGWSMYVMAKLLLTCRFMSLPNLMRDREIMPEFPCVTISDSTTLAISEVLYNWLTDEEVYDRVVAEMSNLRDEVGQLGTLERVSTALLEQISVREAAKSDQKQAA